VETILVGDEERVERAVEIGRQAVEEVVHAHWNSVGPATVASARGGPAIVPVLDATLGCVSVDERFDELIGAISGFYRTWVVYLGLELGYLVALRAAGRDGLTAEELASRTGTDLEPLRDWLRAAHAFELVDLEGGRATIDEDSAVVLLDEQRPEFVGGQFVSTVVASMDWERMTDFLRTGVPLPSRPDRYRRSIEHLTVQDIAVFFVEVLGQMPGLTATLAAGGRVVDVHCGGGRWLVAMARRFPEIALVGIEPQPDSAARAAEGVRAAGFADRIAIENVDVASMGHAGEFDLAYLQFALHDLPDPVRALEAAWASVKRGGRLVVLDWCLPATVDDDRTALGELMWGAQLDQILSGWRFRTREDFRELFRGAGLPDPSQAELPSGATTFILRRPS
jgi:SAM-dependent methyltransferase